MASASQEERLLTGYTGRVSIVLALAWLAIRLGREAVPPLLPTLIEELSITPTEAGVALSVMMGIHALLQYPGGRLSDGLGRSTVLVASVAAAVVGFGVMSQVSSYAGLLLAVAAVGAASGLFFSPARALLSDLFRRRRGQAIGLHTTAGLIGSALAGGLATVALLVATWRAAFLPVIVVLGGVLVLLHLSRREPYAVRWVTLGIGGTARRVFSAPQTRRLLAVATVRSFSIQAVIGFLPALLLAEKGFSVALANGSFALVFVVGALASPVAGDLSDRLSRTAVLVGTLLVGAAGIAVVVLGSSVPVIALGVMVAAAGMWGFPPVVQASMLDGIPAENLGGDFGALKTVYTGIGSLGPAYVGIVAEGAGYATAFAGVVVILLVGVAILIIPGAGR